jgi:uncharacterized protein YraI
MRPLVRLLVIFLGHDSEPTLSDPPVADKAASITDYHNPTSSNFPSQEKGQGNQPHAKAMSKLTRSPKKKMSKFHHRPSFPIRTAHQPCTIGRF